MRLLLDTCVWGGAVEELAAVGHDVVCFRARQQAQVLMRVLKLHGNELVEGAIITAEPGRLRVRPREGG